jgi:rare lipoprotein A
MSNACPLSARSAAVPHPSIAMWRRALAGPATAAALALAGCGTLQPPDGGAPVPAEGSLRPPPSVAVPSPPRAAQPPQATAPTAITPPGRTPSLPPEPPEVVPRVERLREGPPNHPYTIRGEDYEPETTDVPMREVGIASWYGRPFHGRRTATGERYDMNRLSAAHKTMPLPSYARVRNLENGRELIVKVNDRGPFYSGRVIDLSRAAARKLGIRGLARVEVTRLTHDEIRAGAWRKDRVRAFAAKRPAAKAQQQAAAESPTKAQ